MTAKRYRMHFNQKKYDFTYDAELGIWRMKYPTGGDFVTGEAATIDLARGDVRRLIMEATGQQAFRSPEREQFLRAVLSLINDAEHDINMNDISGALAKVNDALTTDRLRTLNISEGWRGRMTRANSSNDAGLVGTSDARKLADIAMSGRA